MIQQFHFLVINDLKICPHKTLHTNVSVSSVAQSCPTLCDPMNSSMPGLPVHHQLPEFTQTHVHRVSDAIQPSDPLSSPSPPAPNPSQQQSLFQWVNSSHEVAKLLEFQLQHHSFQRNFLYPTLCDPMNCSLSGSSVHGILQAWILELVTVHSPGDLPNPEIEPRSPTLQVDSLPAETQGKAKNTGVGSLSLLQQIFLTQESNWGLWDCRKPHLRKHQIINLLIMFQIELNLVTWSISIPVPL